MKKFVLSIALLTVAVVAFAQYEEPTSYDTTGSTMQQPIRPPVEMAWTQDDIGDFSDPVAYVHQRQADVMYYHTIWRTIDLREKMNHHLYFPMEQRGTWRSLAQVIMDALDLDNPDNENALRLYTDEFCNIPKSKEEAKDGMVQRRQIEQIDPETFEVIGTIELEEKHQAKEVSFYNVKEIWFFDKERSVLDVRILEIEPMIEYEKELNTGDPGQNGGADDDMESVAAMKQKKRLGYIMYDELRPFLAKQEVFNKQNNAARLSLDDVLTWKREFNSYIYAEQNVYNDRYISDYLANARDQRIESEKITEKIRTFEHDLWEF